VTAADLVRRVAVPDGGFTVDAQGVGPTAGYVVSIYPACTQSLPAAAVTAETISAFTALNADVLARPGHYLGAWHDPATGKVYLDISVVVGDRATAEELASEHGQLAYFDIDAGRSWPAPAVLSGG